MGKKKKEIKEEVLLKQEEVKEEEKYKVVFTSNVTNSGVNYREGEKHELNKKQLSELEKFVKLGE